MSEFDSFCVVTNETVLLLFNVVHASKKTVLLKLVLLCCLVLCKFLLLVFHKFMKSVFFFNLICLVILVMVN